MGLTIREREEREPLVSRIQRIIELVCKYLDEHTQSYDGAEYREALANLTELGRVGSSLAKARKLDRIAWDVKDIGGPFNRDTLGYALVRAAELIMEGDWRSLTALIEADDHIESLELSLKIGKGKESNAE